MEEVVRAFNYLIESGQALYWGTHILEAWYVPYLIHHSGTSEWSAEEIQDAWRVADKLSERLAFPSLATGT